MALAKDVMGGGFSAGQASAIGGGYVSLAVTGASSTQALAAPVTATNVVLTGGDGTKSAILVGQPGDSCTLFNNSGSTVPVFPPVGAAIAVPGTGLGSANASYAHTTYACCTYTCLTATQWLVEKSA